MGSDIESRLADVAAEIARLESLIEVAKGRRDELIMLAIAGKVPRARIAELAELSEPMIYKIRKQFEEGR